MTTHTKLGEGGVASASPVRCPHCGGSVEVLGRGRAGATIQRCRACGREPSAPIGTPAVHAPPIGAAPTRTFSDVAPGSAPRPCRNDGCPGTLDGTGRCACCARRDAWVAANRPVRNRKLCDGAIAATRKNREYCGACKRARNAIAALTTKAKQQ
jgi:hypothetical protein